MIWPKVYLKEDFSFPNWHDIFSDIFLFPVIQPLVFGAMVHRDEAFETIFNQYVKITSASSNSES